MRGQLVNGFHPWSYKASRAKSNILWTAVSGLKARASTQVWTLLLYVGPNKATIRKLESQKMPGACAPGGGEDYFLKV